MQGSGHEPCLIAAFPGGISVDAFLFHAVFDDGLTVEVQVNPEFGHPDSAMVEAEFYARVVGQLPTGLRRDVETFWIHRGVNPFGGGNNNLLIHTGQGEQYQRNGILAETFVHEAAHTSLDADHANAAEWLAAQQSDPTFISTYARDFPNREDIAESYLPYLAVRYRADRISDRLKNTIEQTIPNRIAYFDALDIDLYPFVAEPVAAEPTEIPKTRSTVSIESVFPNPTHTSATLLVQAESSDPVDIEVIDVSGRRLIHKNVTSGAGSLVVPLEFNHLTSGSYVVRASSAGHSSSILIVVQ